MGHNGKRLLLGICGILILAFVLTALALFLPSAFRAGLRLANHLLPVKVKVAEYRHVPGRLNLSGVRVATPTGARLELAGLTIEYRPMALLLGRIELPRLELTSPEIMIQPFPEGKLNLLEPSTEPREGTEEGEAEREGFSAWTVLRHLKVQEVKVSQGSIRVEDLDGARTLAWDSLDLEGAFSGHPLGGEFRLSRGLLQAKRSAHPGLAMHTQGQGLLNNGLIKLSEFQLTSEVTAVAVGGEYSLQEQRYKVEADLEGFPLDQLLAVLGAGSIEVKHVSGTLRAEGTGELGHLLKADLRAAVYGQQAEARVKGKLNEGRFEAESIDLRNPEVSVRGKASWNFEGGGLSGNFRLRSDLLEASLRPYGITGLRIEGLGAEAELEGTVQDPEVLFRVQLRGLHYHEPLLGDVTADGGYASGRGLFVTGKAETVPILGQAGETASFSAGLHEGVATCAIEAEDSLSLRGRIRLEDQDAAVALRADALSLSFLTKRWIHSASALSLTGSGDFQGNLDQRETWKGEASIEEVVFSLPDLLLRSAQPVEVLLEAGSLRGEADLEANGRPLTLRGSYPLLGKGEVKLTGNASLKLEDFQMPVRSYFPILAGWKGDLLARGSLEGPAREPRLQAVVELSDGLVRLAASSKQGKVTPEGTREKTEGDPEAEAEPQEILAGKVRMRLELEGSVTAPAGSLDVHLSEGTLYGVSLDEVHLKAASRDGTAWQPRLEIRSAEAGLSMKGQWEVQTGKLTGEIHSTELDLSTLVGSEAVPLQGTSLLEGTIAGTVGSPRATLMAHTQSLVIQDIPVGDLEARLEVDPERIALKGKTDSAWFETSMTLRGEQAFSFRGSLEAFPLGALLEAAQLRGWKGTASLAGELTGPLADFEGWTGEISIQQIDLEAREVSVSLEEPVRLGFSEGKMKIPETFLLFGDSPVRIQGTLGRENRLRIQGTIPLRPFAPMIPVVRFDTGKADTDLMIRGSQSSPLLEGSIHLEAKQVKANGLAYPAESLEADIRVTGNEFSLQSLKATVAEGELHGSGTITLEPLAFQDVRLTLKSVPIRLSDYLAGLVHGELALQGNREASSLSGKVRILEARYEEDFNLVGAVLLPSRPQLRRVERPDPLRKNMELDIHVQSGPNLFVRNNLGRLILSTDMEIHGTAARPVPLGTVRVEEGRIFYSNKRFDITQGSLGFLDPAGGSPNINLESKVKIQGQTREYMVYLTLIGPLDRIRLELRSVPDLEREDIVFLLITGKTRDEYYAAADEPTDTGETAQRLAVSGVGALIGSDVRALTGLDTFVMERAEGKEFGVKTTMGRQFNERIHVRGIFALGSGQQVSEAQVGYLLTDMFYVVGTQRTDGSFGLDFRMLIGSR
jgi:autotransporter translocation and assembly factor TamB